MSIELAIRPAAEPPNGIGNILTIFNESGQDLIMIGQWKNHLILRSSIDSADRIHSCRDTELDNVLRTEVLRHLCVVFQVDGVAIYIDGRPARFTRRFPLPAQGKGGTGKLVLGNSPAGKNSWKGDFFFLSFYGQMLTPDEVSRLYLARRDGPDVPEELPAPARSFLFLRRTCRDPRSKSGGSPLRPVRPPRVPRSTEKLPDSSLEGTCSPFPVPAGRGRERTWVYPVRFFPYGVVPPGNSTTFARCRFWSSNPGFGCESGYRDGPSVSSNTEFLAHGRFFQLVRDSARYPSAPQNASHFQS